MPHPKDPDKKDPLASRKRQFAATTMMGQLMKSLDQSEDLNLRQYGYPMVKGANQLHYEMMSFAHHKGLQIAKCTRFDNFRNIVSILWPKIEWNEWLEKQIRSACDNSFVSWTGAAACGKTFAGALYATVWWLCMYNVSAVVLTSTTKNMLRKRMWSEVQKLFTTMQAQTPGNMVDSKTVWQSKKGDEKNAIFGLAVKDGQTSAAVGHIQGIHTRRVLIIIDEATDTPQAIFDATANLFAGCEEFQMIVIGNPNSHFDPHGKFSQPLDGWDSVSVDVDEWETVTQLNGKPGICLRFDAEKSPNIAAGTTKYKYLVTETQLEGARKKYGPDSPLFWKFYRGFWAPSGTIQTVFNETQLAKQQAHHGFFFRRQIKKVAACDPAFGGGDRAVFRIGYIGILDNGSWGLEMELYEEIELHAGSSEPIHYQIAHQVMAKCKRHGIPPECFGLDASGEGGGPADILAKEWSPRIRRVEFGGAPSKRPVTSEDRRPAKDVYDRRVTELWFNAKELMDSGQLRGVDVETAREFCSREYTSDKRKICIQPKKDMKAFYGMSPDLADCSVVLVEVAKLNGMEVYIGDHVAVEESKNAVVEAHDIYDTVGDEFDELNVEEPVYADFA